MRLARATVSGPDGPIPRLLVSGSDGLWLDIKTGYRALLLRGGADLDAATQIATAVVPPSMSRALAGGDAFTLVVERVLDDHTAAAVVEGQPAFTNALDPGSYRDFMVFEEHFSFGYRWQDKPVPDIMYELPVSYAGDPRSFLGPGDTIPWPGYTQRLDYELELGIVIGKAGTNLTPEDALEHVLGLTILNDVSARDIQSREMTSGLGPSKGKHFACVTGPWITTLDEIPSDGLAMTARVNGETFCSTTSDQMVWSVAEIVAWASQGELLRPGALLGSGTCNGGSTVEIDRHLKPGDRLELEIEKLGVLSNVLDQPAAPGWAPQPRPRTSDGTSSTLHFLR
ncbi:fumarylacetoacetate hydrolase family protein [Gordonia polyisoprenivorans]|uniref:fumarylacetoacetate hydrolase family protein n=1 Tax=Gordonia polyisoprenivorans TaxID=84595 RepID=UPI0023001D55|nr:fumarylacetoacetate hydrolase family protein [Gordonia polyisoprenivorans]WCB36895.1 fumarylacetoacetate hydrolase family protein [Gordonia polyisoprenivorans]